MSTTRKPIPTERLPIPTWNPPPCRCCGRSEKWRYVGEAVWWCRWCSPCRDREAWVEHWEVKP